MKMVKGFTKKMKKNRNLIKIFLTLVQIFVLGLPLFAFCFNAVAYRLGLKDLATSVSGNTESSIDESTFLNETNDINKFALQSIYDFNYINYGDTAYNYHALYQTNDVSFIDNQYVGFVVGNVYSLEYSSTFDGDFTSIDFNNFLVLDFTVDYDNGTGNEFVRYYDLVNNNISYNSFGFKNNSTSTSDAYFYIRYLDNYDYVYFRPTSAATLSSVVFNVHLVFLVLDDYSIVVNSGSFTSSGFNITSSSIYDIPFELIEVNVSNLDSFINGTQNMSYEDIVSNNYVNTHLLLNLDIVGLFTNNLSGNAYVYLWLNYFMNYLLTMSIVFICFDVIMYFILIVRKILDRSVEYSDRREF